MILTYVESFLAKTESQANPLPRVIVLKSLREILCPDDMERFLCPCRALKAYIKRTKKILNRPDNLFVSPAKNDQAISKNAISFFLRELLKEAGAISPRAHSIRGVGATTALKLNVAVDKILTSATWKSSNVFQMHYLKEFKLEYPDFSTLGPFISAGQVVQVSQ